MPNLKIEAGKVLLECMIVSVLERISGRADAPGKLPLFDWHARELFKKDARRAITTIAEGIIEECKADERELREPRKST